MPVFINTKIKKVLYGSGALSAFAFAARASAQEDGFVAISPIPGFSENSADIVGFLQTAFQLSVIIAALLTVVMIAIGGFTYMTSDVFTEKKDAKRRIWSAILGLLIILGSWIILNTINPQILNFDILRNASDIRENIGSSNDNNGGGQNTSTRGGVSTGNTPAESGTNPERIQELKEFQKKCETEKVASKVIVENGEYKCIEDFENSSRSGNETIYQSVQGAENCAAPDGYVNAGPAAPQNCTSIPPSKEGETYTCCQFNKAQ